LPIFAFDNTLVSPLPVSVTLGAVVKFAAADKLCLVDVNVTLAGLCSTPLELDKKEPASASSITSYRLLGITVVAFAEP
jgi:hypothetical protein